MVLKCVAESSVEPLTLAEVKLHLRLSTSDTTEDSLLTALIKTARSVGENICKRAFVPHTYQLSFDEFPDGDITLPMGTPLSTSASDFVINYTNSTGGAATLSATAYQVNDRAEPAYVTPSATNEWPDTYDDTINAVTIQYKAGYPLSSSVATTPESIKSWMKLTVGSLYENRESVSVGSGYSQVQALPTRFVDHLLDPYVIIEV